MNTGANTLQPITIVDYGMGNLHSVKKKFDRMNIEARISSSADEILFAGKIILPGIGHFKKAMDTIKTLGLFDVLNEAVLQKKIPILGICLGMQLMAKHSDEGDTSGFGWFDADVVRFNVKDTLAYKVPHTGWNQVINKQQCELVNGIPDNSEFYFVHAYHIKLNNGADALHVTDYEYPFVSAMAKGNIMGVQYHPEKSHQAGEQMLKNFATRY
jgi:imidazole glycerol-phosphate synthase subunit HisH